jgi:hypothetical protein
MPLGNRRIIEKFYKKMMSGNIEDEEFLGSKRQTSTTESNVNVVP